MKQGHARRASVSDVARAAHVSVGTVSNVLNRPDQVSPATRRRVEEAIKTLSFVRNGSARQLRAGTISAVGAIVLDIGNPFFTDLSRGIEARLDERDLTLMLASSHEDSTREARYLRHFEEQGILGVMVVPSSESTDYLLPLQERGVSVVLLDRHSQDQRISSVSVDDVAGGSLAARHLIGLGHENIALLNGPHTIRQCADRSAGVVAALHDAGLDPAHALSEITIDTLNAAGGEEGISRALRLSRRPTATFCVNDLVALGALRKLRREGVSVPHGMAVVGYDDVDFAAELGTPLTSVRQPTFELGHRAASLVLPGSNDPTQVIFQPELIVRSSSAGFDS
ncbi:transcriptional regulator, LacI family [Paraoerskovia marina]|uniref:Transcriptional regulator, LacI family n=1 Tax=Paraoerskovia marina TaxID=545619 RepID=A0A1H1VSA2_9CELL|nr:transcriptional regulator, LacI family [Paraoerskovia marina]